MAGSAEFIPGQRILVGDQVLTYQELAQYFNAKKNVSLPQIFMRVNRDADEVELERSRTRESSLEVTFGLKVRVKALRDVDAELNGVKLKAGTQGGGDAGRPDRLPQRQRDGFKRSAPAGARVGRPVPTEGFQIRISWSPTIPSLLEADDILLSPGTSGDVLLKIFCDYDKRVGPAGGD